MRSRSASGDGRSSHRRASEESHAHRRWRDGFSTTRRSGGPGYPKDDIVNSSAPSSGRAGALDRTASLAHEASSPAQKEPLVGRSAERGREARVRAIVAAGTVLAYGRRREVLDPDPEPDVVRRTVGEAVGVGGRGPDRFRVAVDIDAAVARGCARRLNRCRGAVTAQWRRAYAAIERCNAVRRLLDRRRRFRAVRPPPTVGRRGRPEPIGSARCRRDRDVPLGAGVGE